MRKNRSYTIDFKRQLAVEYLEGRGTLGELSKRHGLERSVIRLWVKKYEAGAYDEDFAQAATLDEYERRIAELERKVGQLTMELDIAKRGPRARTTPADVDSSMVSGPGPLVRERGAK